jgi:ATP/maltotriose-dependent transcriptional regulator MalT
MDGRFEGLERVRQGIDLARRHDIGAVVSLGLGQIGTGCGEMRRYDEAVPALVDAVAWNTEHNYESNRRYALAWLGRCRFDLGQWDEAEAHVRDAVAGSRTVLIASMVGLTTLGWLRARRGDDDVWPPLDEALALARRSGHLQRIWPVAAARAEAGWLAGDLSPHAELLQNTVDLARRCRHRIAVGELGRWLQRAGRDDAVGVDEVAEPFASWIAGDWASAAAGFRRMGCPYEAASALADSDDTTSLREALATFERLGARPMAERVADSLRERGVRVAARRPQTAGPSGLSEREVEVLRLVAAGFTNPQIASALFVSRKTAEHHVSNILAKLGVASRTEAATAAVRLGLAAG